jgi:hypothetical protein
MGVASVHPEDDPGRETLGGLDREGHLKLLHSLDHVRGGDDRGFVAIEADHEAASPHRRAAAHP